MNLREIGYKSFKEFEKDYPSYKLYEKLPSNYFIRQTCLKDKTYKDDKQRDVEYYSFLEHYFNQLPKDFLLHNENPRYAVLGNNFNKISDTFWKKDNSFYCVSLSNFDRNSENFIDLNYFKLTVFPDHMEIDSILEKDSSPKDYKNADEIFALLINVVTLNQILNNNNIMHNC